MTPTIPPTSMKRVRTGLSHLGRAAVGMTVAALVITAVVLVGSGVVTREAFVEVPPGARAAGAASAHEPADDGAVVVAVVLGRTGTVASDVLAPYEVFARSTSFAVYTVAEGAEPAPLTGGTSLVPAHTFADVAAGRVAAPDLVVVPAVTDPTGPREENMRSFVVAQARVGAHILGVCSGAKVLAATGLLDGHRATSHWSGLDGLRTSHPEVDWVDGQRWVRDGDVTTTAGVSSGIPGSLAVVRHLAGPAEAGRIGLALGYPGWELDGPSVIPDQHFTAGDATLALAATLPWLRPDVAVGLSDGVGEIDVAAALEVYNLSAAARTSTIATTPTVTTRHGLVLTAATSLPASTDIAFVVVPGAAGPDRVDRALSRWASDRSIPTMPIYSARGGGGFDAALQHIAGQTSVTTARSVAKMIEYPTGHLDLAGGPADLRTSALAAFVVLMTAVAGLMPSLLLARRARRTR